MIVVGVDFSDDSRAALRWGLREGRAMHSPVVAVHSGPPVYEPLTETVVADERRASLRPKLKAFCVETTGDGGAALSVVDGPPADALIELSKDADLVVVGRQGLGAIARVVLGSVSHDVVRGAHSPVAVVPPTATDEVPERVVVGTDGSDNAAVAVKWAAQDAVRHGVPLVIVHAAPPPYVLDGAPTVGPVAAYTDPELARRFVTEIADKARSDIGGAVPVEATISWLGPAAALLAAASMRSVVVVGSRGIGGLARALLGSTSMTCIEQADCPVVVVPLR